jgi:SAM-dependent methyltransferase
LPVFNRGDVLMGWPMTNERYADYDGFAWIYNRYWGGFIDRVIPVLDQLALNNLPPKSRILDVCCGTGQLAHALSQRGYFVTGVDGSDDMLRFARENAPGCEFILADVRAMNMPAQYSAAFSTFDSLNHILEWPDLAEAFRRVHAALKPGGIFVFDMNLEGGYVARWHGSTGQTADNHAFVQSWSYDADEKLARVKFSLFFLDQALKTWQRTDITLTQYAYSEGEIRDALGSAGFSAIQTTDAHEFNMTPEPGGRMFFVARKTDGQTNWKMPDL